MSFPSLHDALSTLLPGQRGALDWPLRPGMPGFGDGIDIDDRPGGPPHPPGLQDGDADGPPRPPGMADGGNGHSRLAQAGGGHGHGPHGAAEVGLPAHGRPAAGEAMRTPSQPLAPPPSQGTLDQSLQALARELQQLPQSVLRQLGDVLHRNPDVLRSLPAQPEALATALSRAVPDAAHAPQAMAGEARRLAPPAEATTPAARGQEGDGPRESRHGTPGTPAAAAAAGEARAVAAMHEARAPGLAQPEPREARGASADARPAWAAATDPSQMPLVRTSPGGEAPPAAGEPARAGAEAGASRFATPSPHAPSASDGNQPSTANPASHAAPAVTPQAQPSSGASVQEGLQALPARAEAPGATADRGGQAPGISGLGGAAAGVTMAAVASPAGTTHAHAPDAAVRARRGREEIRDQARQHGGHDPGRGGGGDGQPAAGRERDRKTAEADADRSGPARGGSAVAGGGPSAVPAAGNPAATTGLKHGRSNAAARVLDADAVEAAPPAAPGLAAAGHTVAGGNADRRTVADAPVMPPARDAEAVRSRRLQWIYWSLIAVTYGCLGMSLATVAPDLTRVPIAAESLGTWRRALTGVGLLAGLWAWLLARRLR